MARQPYQRQPRRVVQPTYLDNPAPAPGSGPPPTTPPPPPMEGQQAQAGALRGPSMPRPVMRDPNTPPLNRGGQSIAARANSPRGGAPAPVPKAAPAGGAGGTYKGHQLPPTQNYFGRFNNPTYTGR